MKFIALVAVAPAVASALTLPHSHKKPRSADAVNARESMHDMMSKYRTGRTVDAMDKVPVHTTPNAIRLAAHSSSVVASAQAMLSNMHSKSDSQKAEEEHKRRAAAFFRANGMGDFAAHFNMAPKASDKDAKDESTAEKQLKQLEKLAADDSGKSHGSKRDLMSAHHQLVDASSEDSSADMALDMPEQEPAWKKQMRELREKKMKMMKTIENA